MKEQIKAIHCGTCGEATAGLIFDDETESFSVLLMGEGGEQQVIDVDDETPAALRCLRCQDFLVIEFDRVPSEKRLTFLEKMRVAQCNALHFTALKEFREGRASAYDVVTRLVVDGGFSQRHAVEDIRTALCGDGPVSIGADGEPIYSESGRSFAEIDGIMTELQNRLSANEHKDGSA